MRNERMSHHVEIGLSTVCSELFLGDSCESVLGFSSIRVNNHDSDAITLAVAFSDDEMRLSQGDKDVEVVIPLHIAQLGALIVQLQTLQALWLGQKLPGAGA